MDSSPASVSPAAEATEEEAANAATTTDQRNGLQKVSELGPGQTFGELALISNKRRAATITCMTDSHFAVLDRQSFSIIQKMHEDLMEQRDDLLRRVPFVRQLSKMALMKY